jgi:hypothetical protein
VNKVKQIEIEGPVFSPTMPPVSVGIGRGIRFVWYSSRDLKRWGETELSVGLVNWLRENIDGGYWREAECDVGRADIVLPEVEVIELKKRLTKQAINPAVGQAIMYADAFNAEPWIGGLVGPSEEKCIQRATKHVGVYAIINESRAPGWHCHFNTLRRAGVSVVEGMWANGEACQ